MIFDTSCISDFWYIMHINILATTLSTDYYTCVIKKIYIYIYTKYLYVHIYAPICILFFFKKLVQKNSELLHIFSIRWTSSQKMMKTVTAWLPIDQGWEHLEDCAARGVQNRQALYDLHNSPSFDERLAKAVEQKTLQLKDRPGLRKS